MLWYCAMLMKLLLTLLVIIAALVTLRLRKRHPPRNLVASAAQQHQSVRGSLVPKAAAYGLLGLLLSGSALFVYLEWQDSWRVVTVRVIHSGNGSETIYRAYKGDVKGRSFTTVDGRIVNLAEVERLELGTR